MTDKSTRTIVAAKVSVQDRARYHAAADKLGTSVNKEIIAALEALAKRAETCKSD